MLERVLELNLKLRSLARRALSEGPDEEILEEFLSLLREVYEEMGYPNRVEAEDLLRAEPRLGFKVVLTNFSEDLSDFLYRRIGSEWEV